MGNGLDPLVVRDILYQFSITEMENSENTPPQLTIAPIGIIRTGMKLKFETPHQPKDGIEERNVIELYNKKNFEQALADLDGFDRIWLIWWFHKNKTWKPRVLPPRGAAIKRGVFATRSPHRPNPIGMTAVPLIGIQGRNLIIGNTDLLDGTPILDIKPYLTTVDCFPDASLGWLNAVENESFGQARYLVDFAEDAQQQLTWLRANWQIDFLPRLSEILAADPSPHRTRRITRTKDGGFKIGCGAWRAIFTLESESGQDRVKVASISPGYPARVLANAAYDYVPDREAQLAFNLQFPNNAP